MNRKLLLIDGSSLLSTHYHGTLPRQLQGVSDMTKREALFPKILHTTDGLYTNAMFGMLKAILKIIKQQKPSHIAVAWDVSRNTFRREIASDYKGTRKETDMPLKQQFKNMQQLLEAIGIKQLMSDPTAPVSEIYEADDYLGSMAAKFEEEIPVYLLTKDNDYLQLVSEHTRLWLVTSKSKELIKSFYPECDDILPDGVVELTPPLVEVYQGVTPKQCLDLKALCGDTSDNISGVKGVGEKSAVPLIREYGTIENLYAQIEGLTAEEEKLLKEFWKVDLGIARSPLKFLLQEETEGKRGGKAAALESKALGCIKRDIPLDYILEDFKTYIDEEALMQQCKRYEFNSLLVQDEEESAKTKVKTTKLTAPELEFIAAVKKTQDMKQIMEEDNHNNEQMSLF